MEAAVKSSGQKVMGACQGKNFRTCWQTPEVKEAVILKKEAFWAWLAGGSAEAADIAPSHAQTGCGTAFFP